MLPETLRVLKIVRAKLTKPEAWIQGNYARNANGKACYSSDKDAVCWCLDGAFNVALRSRGYDDIYDFIHQEIRDMFEGSVVRWNDMKYRTHNEVLEHLDSCIQHGEKLQARPNHQ